MLRSLPVRVLDDRDLAEASELLARDPVANVFVAARLDGAGPRSVAPGRRGVGSRRRAAGCGRCATPAPTWCRSVRTPRDAVPSRTRDAAKGRRCSSIVGPGQTRSGCSGSCSNRLGPGARGPRTPAADGDQLAARRLPPIRSCGWCGPTSSTCCSRRPWRCSPRRSASRRSTGDGGALLPLAGRRADRPAAGPSRASRTAGRVQGRRSARRPRRPARCRASG